MPRTKKKGENPSSKITDQTVKPSGNLPAKRPRGARSHLSPAELADLKQYLLGVFNGDECLSLEAIAHERGMSRFGLWKRIKEDPDLTEAWCEYVEFKIDMARTTLMKMADGDIPVDRDRLRAIGLFLARYDIHVIRASARVSSNEATGGGPIVVQIVTAEDIK